MTGQTRGLLTDLRAAVADAVVRGRDVRGRIASVVGRAVRDLRRAQHGLRDVAAAVARGAADGARRATQASERGVLRAVVDGLADGIARAALAAKLAIDEAGGQGRRFAREDLDRLTRELADVVDDIQAAFANAFAAAKDVAAGEADDLRRHVTVAVAVLGPALAAALDTVRRNPAGLAGDVARAGMEASREAAGALFEAMGKWMDRALPRPHSQGQ